jgi:hypothetical protein
MQRTVLPNNLTDDHVVSLKQLAELLGMTPIMVRRIPESELPIVRISARRLGITMRNYRRFLETRSRVNAAA